MCVCLLGFVDFIEVVFYVFIEVVFFFCLGVKVLYVCDELYLLWVGDLIWVDDDDVIVC